jgi:hypothetical protein
MGRLHGGGCGRTDAAQRNAAQPDRHCRYGRSHARAVPVRTAVRLRVPGGGRLDRRDPRPADGPRILGLARPRRAEPGAGHRDDAGADAAALFRGQHRLHQDRAGADRALRLRVPGRSAQPAGDRRRAGGHRRGGADVLEAVAGGRGTASRGSQRDVARRPARLRSPWPAAAAAADGAVARDGAQDGARCGRRARRGGASAAAGRRASCA